MAKDAAGKVITGTYSSPITLTESDASETSELSTFSVNSSSTPVNVTYNGNVLASATFSAASSGVLPSNVHAAVLMPTQLLYVANKGNGAPGTSGVAIFSGAAKGNQAPLRFISGSNTKLAGAAVGVAHDTQCNVYVSTAAAEILKFAAGANGNVAPIADITGPATGLAPDQIAVGPTGKIYVANGGGHNVLVFAPGASGNVAPLTSITKSNAALCGEFSALGSDYGIALDSQENINVTSSGNCIAVFASGAQGPSAPIRIIGGTKTGFDKSFGLTGLAIGPTGKIYLTDTDASFIRHDFVYPAGANGNVSPLQDIITPDGSAGIAVNSAGVIFVATSFNSIKVFAANATGNATPMATLAGSNTKLNNPQYIDI